MYRRTTSIGIALAVVTAAACSGDQSPAHKPKSGAAKAAAAGGQDGGLFGNAPTTDGGGAVSSTRSSADAAPATLPPGSCGPGCFMSGAGSGTGTTFDITNNPSQRVGVDADGALVITRDNADSAELIWIANTMENTVSKVDTKSRTELGRYAVPVNNAKQGSENGPSRTSVDSEGSVYAGDRFGDNLTKISAAGDNCPDTNGDGKVTTSNGPKNVLAYGKDDCMIWSTGINGDARGVAVQEIAPEFKIETVPDHPPTVTEIPGARYVWTGGQDTIKLHKLDAATGKILLTLDPPPAPVYGLAVDGRANLWISGKQASSLGRVDTTRCIDASCNKEKVCVTTCTETSCPSTCDSAILERIEFGSGHNPYGITVDCAQRIWLGGAWGGNGVTRYDPLAPADQRLKRIADTAFNALSSVPFDDSDLGIHGIAADASGWVWGAGHDTGVWRIDANSLQLEQVAGTGGHDFNAKGIAVARSGQVWAIPLRQAYALVITPGATIKDATVEKPISGFGGPYTYSDMTGEQRRLAANDPGSYRQRFEGCAVDDKPTKWADLAWDVEVPTGTLVVFLARTADNPQGLDKATWFEITAAPGQNSPIAIEPYIKGAMQTSGRYLEIEVRLITTNTGSESRCSSVPAVTPRVKSFSVSHRCSMNLG